MTNRQTEGNKAVPASFDWTVSRGAPVYNLRDRRQQNVRGELLEGCPEEESVSESVTRDRVELHTAPDAGEALAKKLAAEMQIKGREVKPLSVKSIDQLNKFARELGVKVIFVK